MKNFIIVLLFILPLSPVLAKTITGQTLTKPVNARFMAVQECDNVQALTQRTVINWGEKPLIKAQGVQTAPNGKKYQSSMMYFVNQDTGTWSLIALYPNQWACIIAAGTKMEPYSD